MRDLSWAFALILVLVIMPLRFRSMFRRRALARGERRHTWTSVAMFLAVLGVYAGTAAHLAAGAWDGSWALLAAGALLYGAGLRLRAAAIRTLGAYFSTYIEMRDRQPLIREGPFRRVRHPNYAGLLLEAAGLPLAFEAWPVLLFVIAVFVPVLLARIRLEERELVRTFGDAYLAYRSQVGALIPGRSRAPAPGGVS
jgi:protein-S-isoprenylcysteine O-methyltransferase Ste14